MRTYEMVVILDPSVDERTVSGTFEKLVQVIPAEGGTVVLVGRSEIAEEVAAGLNERAEAASGAGRATAVTGVDLEQASGAEQFVCAALEAHGRIDVLINDVGGTQYLALVENLGRVAQRYPNEAVQYEGGQLVELAQGGVVTLDQYYSKQNIRAACRG